MAYITERDRNTPRDWGAVAVVRGQLQSVIDAHSVATDWLCEPQEGGWLREVELGLETGGLAFLGERRAYPGEFTVHLVRHRDQFFFREDFEEVLGFLRVDSAEVQLLTGQVRWWKKKRPSAQVPEAKTSRPKPPGALSDA